MIGNFSEIRELTEEELFQCMNELKQWFDQQWSMTKEQQDSWLINKIRKNIEFKFSSMSIDSVRQAIEKEIAWRIFEAR